MSNQETEDVLYWRLGKLDCNATMGNEQLGILHHPQNRSFGNTEESTLNYWPLVIMNIELQHKGINF